MRSDRFIPLYQQPDVRIEQLVNLKLEYFWSDNVFIKTIIRDLHLFVIFKEGSAEAITDQIEKQMYFSEEQKRFVQKVEAIIS